MCTNTSAAVSAKSQNTRSKANLTPSGHVSSYIDVLLLLYTTYIFMYVLTHTFIHACTYMYALCACAGNTNCQALNCCHSLYCNVKCARGHRKLTTVAITPAHIPLTPPMSKITPAHPQNGVGLSKCCSGVGLKVHCGLLLYAHVHHCCLIVVAIL